MSVSTGDLLDAMVAHDHTRLPLASDARYTENGQTLAFGDGLWGTLTGYASPGQFRVDFNNAFFGATVETSTPGALVLRMKTWAGRITEVEAISVRVETAGERGGTVTLFQPPLLAQMTADAFAVEDGALVAAVSREEGSLTAPVDAYFESVVDPSKMSSIAARLRNCKRRDNGVLTTGNEKAVPLDPKQPAYRPYELDCAAQIESGFFRNYTRLRGLRHLAVDPTRGLVLSVALLDQPGDVAGIDVPGIGRVRFPSGATAEELASTEGTPQFYVKRHEPNFRVPLTQLMAQLTRIENGNIVRMEAISRPAPYGVTTGWPS